MSQHEELTNYIEEKAIITFSEGIKHFVEVTGRLPDINSSDRVEALAGELIEGIKNLFKNNHLTKKSIGMLESIKKWTWD